MQKMRTELGRRIRELRKTNGWSQEELGEKAELHPTYVGGIERGERNLGFENLCRLAGAFNLSLPELFDFPKTRQTKRDTLRAKISGLLKEKSEQDLDFLLTVLEAADRWKAQLRS